MIQQFFNSEVFTITFVIALYLLNYKLYRLAGTTLLHPVLLTIIELIVLLMYLDVPYDTFKSGSRMIHFMLGPSVVSLGYILHLTAVIVVCAGILGSIIGPPIMKLMGIKSPVAKGLAMGASSHGIGTAAAIQMGAIEGALSGLAIGIMGLITALLLPLFARWLG